MQVPERGEPPGEEEADVWIKPDKRTLDPEKVPGVGQE